MTLFIVLLYGIGTVLAVSGFETDPKTGRSPSIVETVQEVWSGTVAFTSPFAPILPANQPVQPTGGSDIAGDPLARWWDAYHDVTTRNWIRSQQG